MTRPESRFHTYRFSLFGNIPQRGNWSRRKREPIPRNSNRVPPGDGFIAYRRLLPYYPLYTFTGWTLIVYADGRLGLLLTLPIFRTSISGRL